MPSESGPGKPKAQIEIYSSDNFYVLALKTIMNETGMQLHEAVREYKSEALAAEKNPPEDFFIQVKKAEEQISQQIAKKKFS